MDSKVIGERIKNLRISKLNISQEDFANKIGFDRTYISRLESGQKNPTIDTLSKICEGFGIKLKDFFDFEEENIESNNIYKDNGLNVLSLFSNIGVAEAYLKDLGFHVSVANEIVKRRAKLYSDIYPDTKMICGDINNEEVINDIIFESIKANVNVIMATPPCQGMSTAGQQLDDDERNLLICPVVHIIKKIKPQYVFIENVPMFFNTKITVSNETILIPDYLEKELTQDYIVKKYIIDTKEYSVPQSRERAIILLSRKDSFQWVLPEKDKNIVTMRDAIGYLPSIDPFIKDVSVDEMLKIFPDYYKKEQQALSISRWNRPPRHILRQVIAMQHTPTGCTAFDNDKYYPTKDDGSRVKGYHNTYKRQNWDTPAYTVTMDNVKISSQNNVHPGRLEYVNENGECIYSDARVLTLYELMLITSLPKDWPIPVCTSEAFIRRIIGEGIPPLFVKKVFAKLKEGNNNE